MNTSLRTFSTIYLLIHEIWFNAAAGNILDFIYFFYSYFVHFI